MLRASFPTLQKEKRPNIWKTMDAKEEGHYIRHVVALKSGANLYPRVLYFLVHANNTIPLETSLIKLTHDFFHNRVYIRPFDEILKKLSHSLTKIHHFVDFVLKCHRPLPSDLPTRRKLKTLTIPKIFFRNLIAYEQCELHDHYINDYVFVMDRLVDSPRDVELLVKSGILESMLSDSEAAAEFINSLGH
ncbi:hypothetical protein GBA52_013731, partial [Prunus armeniaca]